MRKYTYICMYMKYNNSSDECEVMQSNKMDNPKLGRVHYSQNCFRPLPPPYHHSPFTSLRPTTIPPAPPTALPTLPLHLPPPYHYFFLLHLTPPYPPFFPLNLPPNPFLPRLPPPISLSCTSIPLSKPFGCRTSI